MSNENNNLFATNVVVSAARYQDLIEKESKFEILTKMILDTAHLNYKKSGLIFDDNIIDAALRATYPSDYSCTLTCLQIKADDAAKAEVE